MPVVGPDQPAPPAGHRPGERRGVVARFDAAVGLGQVRDDADGARYLFHCTELRDGTRSIDEGVAVRFVVGPGHGGTWEARSVERA